MINILKKIALGALLVFGLGSTFAQQPQTQNAPLFATNAKYTNGVAPGYYPTQMTLGNLPAQTGLNINIGPGTSYCSTTIQQYSGGTVTLTNNTTNYIYLDETNVCTPTVSTSNFDNSKFPIAIVVTSSGSITSVIDVRTFFNDSSGSSSGSSNFISQVTPPAPGQSVTLYANSVFNAAAPTGTWSCIGGGTAGYTFAQSSSPFSGSVTRTASSSTLCPGSIALTWTGATLPAYVNPVNVSAIYAGFVESTQCFQNNSNSCGFFGATVNTVTVQPAGQSWPLGTYTTQLCSGSACSSFNYAAVSWEASNNSTLNGFVLGSGTFMPVLFVYYTGSVPPSSTQVQVAPPLNYANNILSLIPCSNCSVDYGTTNTYAATIPGGTLSAVNGLSLLIPGTTVYLDPANSSTSTTPTLNVNGLGAETIQGPTGSTLASGDIVAGHEAVFVLDPSNDWRLQNPQVSSGGCALTLTTTGSSGASTLTGCTLNIPVYSGGGGGTPGGSNGQFQYNASGSFAGTVATFYAQTGDTLASIAALCGSNKIIYVVDQAQTITLSGNATVNACVNVRFTANGIWTVNGGGDTLTIPGSVEGPPTQHFAGTAFVIGSSNTPVDYAEWFGAIGDGSTNDAVALQSAINFEGGNQSGGFGWGTLQLLAKVYVSNSTLNITSSSFNLKSVNQNADNAGSCSAGLKTTTASLTQISILGTSGNFITDDTIANLCLDRSTSPSGTATGISVQDAYRTIVDTVTVFDPIRGIYVANIGAGGTGRFDNVQIFWTATTGCAATFGFYVDETTGSTPSLRVRNSTVGNSSACSSSKGFYATGSTIQDIHVTHFETSEVGYGIYLNSTGGAGLSNGDVHFWQSILDGCQVSCIFETGLTTSSGSSVEFNGGNFESDGAAPTIDIESSNGVSLSNLQIVPNPVHSGTTACVKFGGGSGNSLTGGQCLLNIASMDGVLESSTKNNAITGVTFIGTSSSDVGIALTSSSRNSIVGNTMSGTMGTGVSLDASSSFNDVYNVNQIDPTSITTPVSNLGSNNQIGVGGSGSGTSVGVNGGSSLGTLNLNGTTPAAPGGNTNCTWQVSGTNVSCYVPTGGGSGGNYVNLGSSVTWAGCTFANGACTVGSGGAASVSISSIPGTYVNLHIFVMGNVTETTGENWNLIFNGDSSADYNRAFNGGGTSTNSGTNFAQTSVSIGASSGQSGSPTSSANFTVFNYTNTSFGKNVSDQFEEWVGSGSAFTFTQGIFWNNPVAITSMTFTDGGGGDFIQGTQIEIYGTN